ISMMRLARIVRDARDLDGAVRSLPISRKNAQASSNASQTIRVLLKSNVSGVSIMTHLLTPIRKRTDAQKGPVRRGLEAGSLCDGGLITKRLRPPQSEVHNGQGNGISPL